MRTRPVFAHVALVSGSILAAMVPAAAIAQMGRGDEATINAHRVELDARLVAAEKAGAMSHAEAARHHRALDRMDRSAKADLWRPPHFISAADNATYQKTIAAVETALKKAHN